LLVQQAVGVVEGRSEQFAPTAGRDAANREVVVNMIDEKKRAGVAIVAIVHDDEIRHLIADRVVDVTAFAAAA
jgi:alpha-D-ribose 1-methylphosphonate 5-triphosphate synthase subunit PhnL